jgi:hypothetical protein
MGNESTRESLLDEWRPMFLKMFPQMLGQTALSSIQILNITLLLKPLESEVDPNVGGIRNFMLSSEKTMEKVHATDGTSPPPIFGTGNAQNPQFSCAM